MEKTIYVGNNEVSAFVGCTPNSDDRCLVFAGEDLQFIAKYDRQTNQWMSLSSDFAWTPNDRWCYLSDVFGALCGFEESTPEPYVVNGAEVDHEERISKLEEKCDYLQKQIAELREQIKNLPQVPSSPLTPIQPYVPYQPYVPDGTPYPVWPPQVWCSVKPNWVAPDYTITCTTNFEHSNK